MSSSSDIRDMMDLPKQKSQQGEIKPPPPKKMKTEPKRFDGGIQRELFSLLGENTPPMSIVDNKYKNRPDWRNKQKSIPWKWSKFVHTGREDGLELHHWVRAGNEQTDDNPTPYTFSKYNTSITLPEITQEDYDQGYKDEEWSMEETRYLFEMCKEYDLRWLVVHDRYNYPGEKQRRLEDLKARFYSVYKAIFKLRQDRGETLTPAEEDMVKHMKYSKESELKRKDHLEKLLKRSPAEIAEEEALVIESRKLEAAAERMLAERQELMRLLDAPQAPNSSIAEYQTSQGLQQLTNNLLSDKTKRRKDHEQPPVPVQSGSGSGGGGSNSNSNSGGGALLPSNTSNGVQQSPGGLSNANGQQNSASSSSQSQVKQEKKQSGMASGQQAVQALLQKKISSREEASLGLSYHEKLQAGVHFRSSKITTYKPAVQAKVAGVLQELGLPPRPTMPTAKVCAKFESIQHSINVLLDTKRAIDKLETEIKVLRNKN